MGRKLFSAALLSAMALTFAFQASATPVEVKYEAKSVKITAERKVRNNCYISQTKAYMLVGVGKDGYQIWESDLDIRSSTNYYSGDYDYGDEFARWSIDGGEAISTHVCYFERNTVYGLDIYYKNAWWRNQRQLIYVCNGDFSQGKSYKHFIKPTSQTTGLFLAHQNGTDYAPDEFSISSHVNIKLDTVTYDMEKKMYRAKLSWNLDNLTHIPIDKVTIYAQLEGIVSPIAIDVIARCDAITYIDIPWNIKNATFTAKVTPMDKYKFLFHDEITTDTIRHEFTLNDLPCSVKVDDLRNSYDADYGTYNPEVEWTCPEGYEDLINKVNIDYSVDNGATWRHGLTTNTGAGTGKIHYIMPGYKKYIFRYNGVADSWMEAGDAINITAYDTIEVNYKPQINRLELVGRLTDNYDEQTGTFSPTVAYSINRDLYEMSVDKATLEYSVDGGEYKTAEQFFADEDGTQPVTVEANGKSYQFRLRVSAWSEGKTIYFEEESPVYQRFMGVEGIEADDNQPVDVYTLDGKLVAKQMLPSDAKTRLAAGTYIIGGKKTVINK